MIESLLFPKKLAAPPQLLVDVAALFSGKFGNFTIPLVGYDIFSGTEIKFRLIDVSSDGSNTFRIGFINKLIRSNGNSVIRIALPFQSMAFQIDEIRCHGWDTANADLLSTPSKTEIRKSSSYIRPIIQTIRFRSDGYSSLFKMKSDEFEGDGSGKQFQSAGLYAGLDYSISNNIVAAGEEFTEMFNNYSDKMMALEVIVMIKVYSGTYPSGFQVGIM